MKIAFGYKMGSGKDTAVDYLIEKFGGKKISFASPIYDILANAQKVCGFMAEKDRKFLQFVGTEWARKKEDNVWVRLALEKTPKDSREHAYISDVRFPNEFHSLKENGWTCIKLIRNVDKKRKGSGSETHISETALDIIPDDQWDYVIHNDGDLKEFYDKLHSIIYFRYGYKRLY